MTIEDDGIGLSQEQITGILSSREQEPKGMFEKVGLRSVNERLKLTFGDRYGLSIESLQGVYTKMKMLIPYRKSEY